MKGIAVAACLVLLAPARAAPQASPQAAPPGGTSGTARGSKGAAKGTAKPSAEDARTEEARARFRRGAQLYREARYREAIAEFQAAYRIKPSGILHFNVGQAQEKLGETSAALASYEAYLREEPNAPNRETVQRAIANLKARPGADAVAPSPPPGTAAAVAPASPPSAAPAAGSRPDGTASLAASPAVLPPEATRPVPAPRPVERKSWMAPIILGGVAVVAAGAGALMGVQAKNAQDQLLAGAASRSQADSLAKKAQNSATAANVLYGVAGASVLAGGAVLVFGGYF
jgi:tetratricopeptide (TPR) repeat protein